MLKGDGGRGGGAFIRNRSLTLTLVNITSSSDYYLFKELVSWTKIKLTKQASIYDKKNMKYNGLQLYGS